MWYSIQENTPICYETGVWDGKRSEVVLVELKKIKYLTARMYEGFSDGSSFQEWYCDSADYVFDSKDIRRWMYIPD